MIGGVALFVISGISAAGKSTAARLLAGRFERGVCVPGDTIREMVISGRADMRPDAGAAELRHLLLRYAATLAVAEVFLDGGFDVVVEDVINSHVVARTRRRITEVSAPAARTFNDPGYRGPLPTRYRG